MKRSSAVFSRRFKSIPGICQTLAHVWAHTRGHYIIVLWFPSGNLKVDISAPFENMPCCLTSNLWEVSVQSLIVCKDIQSFKRVCVKYPEFYKSVCKDILSFARVCVKYPEFYKSVCKDILSCSTEREVMTENDVLPD